MKKLTTNGQQLIVNSDWSLGTRIESWATEEFMSFG
jgi:hypothetical protein